MGSLIKNNPFIGLYEGHGEPVRHGADEFIRKHGADNLQPINVLNSEFLLHAGDEVFSSFQPRNNPTIIRLGPGREFYEHDNWILSTAGMGASDRPYGVQGNMNSHNDTMAAVNNHYNLAFDINHLRHRFLENIAGWDVEDHYHYTGEWNFDEHVFLENRGGSPELHNMPPEMFQSFMKVLSTESGLERVIDDHPSFNVFDLRNPNGISNPRVRQAMESLNVEPNRITLPNGVAASSFTRPTGLLQWSPKYTKQVVYAYMNGKQIVFHPDYAMPDKIAYPVMKFPPFDQNLDSPWRETPEIEWDDSEEIDTLIRTHVYPKATADQLVPLGPGPEGWRSGRE